MHVKHLTPILNVSDMRASFDWFRRLGFTKHWEWDDPPTFGGVSAGPCEIFLCLNAQGGRGKGDQEQTFGSGGDEQADKGVWMSVWVDNVDEVLTRCVDNDIEITWPPEDMPWGVREMHVRHPDGHVFRISQALEEEEE
ncbi:MAG: bleomycin resistance family protein [Rhodothermales bacterium]|nr:bleomycin resistance family protein [Rhodothermales bacterium]